MKEIWKDVVGYEGLYMISSMGCVKSVDRQVWKGKGYDFLKGQILKAGVGRVGYPYVVLCQNGRKKTYYVHKLVALAFIPNPDNKPQIDHINTIKTDNRVENLRWVTRKENMNNPITKVRMCQNSHMKGKKSSSCYQAKPIVQLSIYGDYIRTWAAIIDVYRELGISDGNINMVIKGKRNHAGGYKWMYKSDYYAKNSETA